MEQLKITPEFLEFLKFKNPNLNVETALTIIEEEINNITLSGPDDNHPNKDLNFLMRANIVTTVMMSVLRRYKEFDDEERKDYTLGTEAIE